LHDEIAIASLIGRRSICGHYLGGVLLRTPNQDIIDLVVDGCKRKSRIEGNEYTQRYNCRYYFIGSDMFWTGFGLLLKYGPEPHPVGCPLTLNMHEELKNED
jgi:hypothetical protein